MRLTVTFLLASLSGTLLYTIIRIFQGLLEKRCPKRWLYYAWLPVMVVFLLPFHFDLIQMQPHTLPHSDIPVQLEYFDVAPKIQGEISQTLQPEPIQKLSSSTNLFLKAKALFPYVWGFGILFSIVLQSLQLMRFYLYLRKHSANISEKEREKQILMKISNGRKSPNLYCCQLPISPCLIGSQVFIPDIQINDEELELVLMHELHHFFSRDIFIKILMQLIVAIHWFNPIVYSLRRNVNKLCELSCDETVVNKITKGERELYAKVLLKINIHNKTEALALGFGAEPLEKRIQTIVRGTSHKYPSKLVAIIVVILLCTSCFAVANAVNGFNPVAVSVQTKESMETSVDSSINGTPSDNNLTEEPIVESLPIMQELPTENFDLPDYQTLVYPVNLAKIKDTVHELDIQYITIDEIKWRHYPYTISDIEIYSIADGKVIDVSDNGYGLQIITIEHDASLISRYCQKGRFLVEVGEDVKAGQCIAFMDKPYNIPELYVEVGFMFRVESQSMELMSAIHWDDGWNQPPFIYYWDEWEFQRIAA